MTAPIQLADGIRLLSGAMFDYSAPEKCEVHIRDIAGALSKVCRFAGHIDRFYSVAQHAVNVSRIVPAEHAWTALMHDTAEAFTNDLPTPLKHAFPAFRELEQRIEAAMAARFQFTFPLPQAVKVADLQMLKLEKIVLKRDFTEWGILDGVETRDMEHLADLSPHSPDEAGKMFLARAADLIPFELFTRVEETQ